MARAFSPAELQEQAKRLPASFTQTLLKRQDRNPTEDELAETMRAYSGQTFSPTQQHPSAVELGAHPSRPKLPAAPASFETGDRGEV